MTAFSNKFKKNCFLDHFWGKKFFSRKSSFFMHNFTWVSSTMAKFRKEKKDGWKDRMMVGRNNWQTLFYRNLPATTWGSNSAFNQILQHNFSFEKSWEFSRYIQQQYTPKELHCLLLHSDIDKLYIFYCETFW